MQRDQIAKTEGNTISTISFRLTSDRYQKLMQVMSKIGVEPLKDGDDKSEKLRLFIDKLYEHHILGNPAGVTANSSDGETGYGAFAHLRSVKERITIKQGIMWVTCAKDNQAHRINDCHNCNDPNYSACKEAVKKYMEA